MKASAQILRNVLGNWLSIFLGMIVGFLMMPFLIHSFGDDRYGLWVLTINFTGYLGLLNLGVGGSVVKYVAEYKAKNEKTALNEICTAAFCLYLGTGLLAAILAVIIAVYGIPHFKIPAELLEEARYVVLIVGFQIAASIPLGTFSSFMRGIQRYDAVALISVFVLLIRTSAIVWFVRMGYGLICLALIHLIATILEGLMRAVYVYRKDHDFKLGIRLLNRKGFKVVFDYSLFFFLFFASFRLIFAIDSLLIGYFLGTAAITFYAVAHRLIEYIRLLVMGTAVFQPTVSQMQALNQYAKNRLLMVVGTKYVMMISLPIGASYILIGDRFLNLWIGYKYASMSYSVLIILTLGIIGFLAQHIAIQVLQGLARHRLAAYTAILQALISIILIVLLMKGYGIAGAAAGKALPMIVFNFLWIPWYTCRELEMPYRTFLKEAFLQPFLSVLIFSFVLYTLSRLFMIGTWVTFCIEIFLSLSVYFICAFSFCFSREERAARLHQLRAAVNIAR